MAKKYYAVRSGKGGKGIYFTWEDCKRQVHGVAGAVYKSFPTLQEAQAFLKGGEDIKGAGFTDREEAPKGAGTGDQGRAVAYVDGSYDQRTGDFACGAVLFFGQERREFSQRFTDPQLAQMHNVAGEIMGVLTVLRYCQEQGVPAVEIYHDYEGLARWADGSWKANKPGTQSYAAACREAAKTMEIRFVKVKGHSGDKYNDRADQLARRALGL